MTEVRGELSESQERTVQKPVPPEELFSGLVHHYFGERGGAQRGIEDARRRAVEQFLMSQGLDALGILRPRDNAPLTKKTVISCQRVVEYLAEETPEALSDWMNKNSDDVRRFFDGGDVRIGVILRLAQRRLSDK